MPEPAPVVAAPLFLVDDDNSSRELVALHLRRLGICNPLLQADDGVRAVELLAAADVPPALILLDLQMPRMSGLDLVRWLNDQPRFRAVPVIMLTSSGEREPVDDAHALGVRSYLVKPVGYAALEDVLRRVGLRWLVLPSDETRG